MTAQLLSSELTNLIQESKRKHNDLRQAAEKSLEELRSIRNTSEAQIGAELSQRSNFVNPFVIACGTKNAKFTGIAIVCLQRLIVSHSLPRSKLAPVLEALREATSAGLDVQLKILQGLPSLLQNYADYVKGDLLVTALNICFILQSSKNAIVTNTSAATLQQLVVSVFDKVVAEDRSSANGPLVGEALSPGGKVKLQAAALDAYHVFNDLCLMTEGQRPEYLRFTGLPQTFGLELIESILTNHSGIFTSHPEQAHVLRLRVMPLLTSSLKGKPNFATTVRVVRILYTILRRHLNILQEESGDALDIMTHLLDQDTAHWRRSLCMEVFRGIFAEPGLLRKIYMLYDAQEDERDVMKVLTATFVRISTEKPSAIGLGHASSLPVSNQYANVGAATDQAMLEASGMTGLISGSVSDAHSTGISTQWSSMRVPCIDQLDKTDAPSIPESYLYSLTLACITSLSEGLAKFIIPLTVPTDNRRTKKVARSDSGQSSPAPAVSEELSPNSKGNLERSASFKKNPIPVNPLHLEGHPLHHEVEVCAQLVEDCWPAILATCSTFMSAALDSEYYHGLVRAFQRFAHVAGLLQLDTPRDAFLTTLGKSAVPPNVFTACLNLGTAKTLTPIQAPSSATTILGNARGLLSVDSLVSQDSAPNEKPRQQLVDTSQAALNTRNLLCLRALLNLGIALGPTLGGSWRIILETLQQADLVLFTTGKTAGKTPLAGKGQDTIAEKEASQLLSSFNSEVRAVETAASRLLESTVDFPNGAFVQVVDAVCNLLETPEAESSAIDSRPSSSSSSQPIKTPRHHRMLSISTAPAVGSNQEDQFALAKLGDLASINIERLLRYPPNVSGWNIITDELIATMSASAVNPSVRQRAADILVRFVLESTTAALSISDATSRSKVQLRLLEALRDSLSPLQRDDRMASVAGHGTDIDIHRTVLEGLKSILENCGESLLSGWDIAFQIIASIFVERQSHPARRGSLSGDTTIMTRSGKLIRSSFGSLQLICSDFLASLPNSCFLILVDTLYKFCSQVEDLNIALTTVTFFWVLSDFLSGRKKSLSISSSLMQGPDGRTLLEAAADPDHDASDAALWMLLLLRLTAVASDQRLELRKSAIQTLLRIFDAYGDSLNAEAWSICIKSVIFRLLSALEGRLEEVYDGPLDVADGEMEAWSDTAVVVLSGISDLLADHLQVLSSHQLFNGLWQELLNHFASLLDFRVLDINTAIFKALGKILSTTQSRDGYNKDTISRAWELWSRGIPNAREAETNAKFFDNQNCLTAYVSALRDVYRLIQGDLSVDRVRRMLTLLREALQIASVGTYVVDIEYVTPLQGQVLEAVTMVRTDLRGVPSVMITQVAEFVSLAFNPPDSPTQAGKPRRTYVAMSKSSMSILQDLILRNTFDGEIYSQGAFTTALAALAKPITLKYQFSVMTKVAQPWRVATTTAITVLSKSLPHLSRMHLSREVTQDIWARVVTIATGILAADYISAPPSSPIAEDQDFDISSFRKLRDLIVPAIGAKDVADATRKAYAEALFTTSIIHPPAPTDLALTAGTGESLAAMYDPRLGRTIDFPPTRREKMAYVALEEMTSLLQSHDDQAAASTPTITIHPPTPKFPPPRVASSDGGPPESMSELHVRLARTAAPFLIVRAGLTLRTYVADTPLRGAMPQPLSQRKEVATLLESLVKLKSASEAIPVLQNVDSQARKHLLRLYPLLVKVVDVAGLAGDAQVLKIGTRALEVVGEEFGG
ncbi:endosomal peripheral membrane protein [Zalerion maritima]|uniref:Endosomal peripheral membrane protein n=1 Tax=Zalerion maritima TaxID=339359 RepID=A0AAD5WS82_9PEZI|nr:endosomal peripheral membrane protein [Zalerion maritima]